MKINITVCFSKKPFAWLLWLIWGRGGFSLIYSFYYKLCPTHACVHLSPVPLFAISWERIQDLTLLVEWSTLGSVLQQTHCISVMCLIIFIIFQIWLRSKHDLLSCFSYNISSRNYLWYSGFLVLLLNYPCF